MNGTFGQTFAGPLIATAGGGVMGIVAEPVLVQPLALTVTPRTTLPLEPAVKVIVLVFCPDVIVPLVIVQRNDAPVCETDAVLPVDNVHTPVGALIVAVGFAAT